MSTVTGDGQSSRQRPNDAASSSRAPSVEREERRLGQTLRAEPQHGDQVPDANHHRRRSNGVALAAQHGPHHGRGSHGRGVPAAHPAAARRCPRMPARQHPQAHSFAIGRVSKFTDVEFRDNAGKINGADFLRGMAEAFPHAIHTVPTDNGAAFADLPKNRGRPQRSRPCSVATSATVSARSTTFCTR